MSVEGMKLSFQPKGGMCAICAGKDKDCSQLEFYKMLPIIEKNRTDKESVMIVRCSEFKRLH